MFQKCSNTFRSAPWGFVGDPKGLYSGLRVFHRVSEEFREVRGGPNVVPVLY